MFGKTNTNPILPGGCTGTPKDGCTGTPKAKERQSCVVVPTSQGIKNAIYTTVFGKNTGGCSTGEQAQKPIENVKNIFGLGKKS